MANRNHLDAQIVETRLDQLEMPLNATPVEASVSKLDTVEGVLLRVGQRLHTRLIQKVAKQPCPVVCVGSQDQRAVITGPTGSNPSQRRIKRQRGDLVSLRVFAERHHHNAFAAATVADQREPPPVLRERRLRLMPTRARDAAHWICLGSSQPHIAVVLGLRPHQRAIRSDINRLCAATANQFDRPV
ncbi:MAG: hypothetical protein BWZ07_02083 [Alphaproteobacteria bacterium ADurb.BinA280]|nr:MAG: hypothetical protein BWZ07_02083 [Alphaproteobacteria bacterium ADurb.BinA280]